MPIDKFTLIHHFPFNNSSFAFERDSTLLANLSHKDLYGGPNAGRIALSAFTSNSLTSSMLPSSIAFAKDFTKELTYD